MEKPDWALLTVPDLRRKVALDSGASLGIGAAVARAFAAQGMSVTVHYNRLRGQAAKSRCCHPRLWWTSAAGAS